MTDCVAIEPKVPTVEGRNGGKLLPGGQYGNAGGGAPSSKVRAICRTLSAKNLHKLDEILNDANEPTREKIRAMAVLLQHGLDGQATFITAPEVLEKTHILREGFEEWHRLYGVPIEAVDELLNRWEAALKGE